MLKKNEQTTGRYLRNRFLRVILATLGFALLPLILIAVSQSVVLRERPRIPDASELISASYEDIDVSELEGSNNSLCVVDKDLHVIPLYGDIIIDKTELTQDEWIEFIKSTGQPSAYDHDIAYSDGEDGYWLVMRSPRAVSFVLALYTNPEAPDYSRTMTAFIAIWSVYYVVLILFVVFYSGSAARRLTASVEKVSQDARKLEDGVYEIPTSEGETSELTRLSETISHLADRLKEREDIREEEEKKRMLLVSELSHDLKTPLAGIQGFSEMLINGVADDKRKQEYLRMIHDDSIRSNEILQTLLTYSKLGSSGYSPVLEAADLCETTREIIAAAIPLIEDAGFTYGIDIPDDEIRVMINRELFRRLFDNLVGNSIKYNERGTRIDISIKTAGDKVLITFSDDGIGIPKEHADDIFTPFYRIEDNRNDNGSGLGLAIVKRIVELHGGEITYVDGGKGCTFRITIPAV